MVFLLLGANFDAESEREREIEKELEGWAICEHSVREFDDQEMLIEV